MPSYSSSVSPSVAASPAPPTATSTNTQNNSAFRSLRSFLPFGQSKNQNSSSSQGTSSKNAFSGFSSMRRSLTRERNTSLTNLLPIISIDRPQAFGDGYTRRAASFSTIEAPSSPPRQARQSNEFGSLGRHSISEAAPTLRSISPCPPLSADLSTIIEADSSCASRTDTQSSTTPSPLLKSDGQPLPSASDHHRVNAADASLDLSTNHIAKEVYDAIMEKDAVAAEDWLDADQPIVIDADNMRTNTSINIEHVDPSVVALLTPNNLRKGGGTKKTNIGGVSPMFSSNSSLSSAPSRRTTSSSIPRLRSPTTYESPNASGSTVIGNNSQIISHPPPSSNGIRRRIVSPSPLSSSSEMQTRIPVNTRINGSFGSSFFDSSSGSGFITGPAEPQHLPPATTPRHSPHASTTTTTTATSSSSSGIASTTAPSTPNSTSRHGHHDGYGGYAALGLGASIHAPSISRQNSESSGIFWRQRVMALGHGYGYGQGSEFFYEDAAKAYGGRASFDSARRPSEQPVLVRRPSSGSGPRVKNQVKGASSEPHVLATSTPFRRSGGGTEGDVDPRPRTMSDDTTTTTSPGSPTFTRGGRSEAGDSVVVAPSSPILRRGDENRSMSPKSKTAGGLRPVLAAPFRSRKRSMSVQEPHRAIQSLLGKRQDAGEHHRLNGASRSNSSLGRERDDREEVDESRRPPHHDWLGPRSVKALRAAGLLNDDRDVEDKYALTTITRDRSGSVATSVSGGSGSGKASLSGLSRSSSASEYSPQNDRAQSRMAFSDVGGPGRRENGTFSQPYLMHSPTLTTSTNSGSRDRDTPRSATSTAPTSVSSTSLAYLNGRERERERERDEIRELKEKHVTEMGALLGALSDSQRTTRVLREENHDLRERMERMGDLEGENEELRREMRGLRREVNELKIQLLTATGGRGSRNGWLAAGSAVSVGGRRSGVNTPVEERKEWIPRSSISDADDTEDVFRPPSVWSSHQDTPSPTSPSPPLSAPDAPASPETPRRHHRRCPSDASSVFPVLPSNMSMLLHEDNGLLNDQGSSHGGSQSSADITPTNNGDDDDMDTAVYTGPLSSSMPVSFRKAAVSSSTPAANRNNARMTPSTSVSISPTTANFSIMTGSPGSLFLKPEHEVHLGDMETFSLDFGSRMDEVGDLVEDW
ncbi:hypothetical protein F5887DRAFT_974418 [Amanita rubescens]|nr:hypothetical protein F5887DRAFT_974418 [Amanita rubescens]